MDSLETEVNQVILYRGKSILKTFSLINPESINLLYKNKEDNLSLMINQRSDKIYTQEWAEKKRFLTKKMDCFDLSKFNVYDFYNKKLILSGLADTLISLQYEIDSNGILIKGTDKGILNWRNKYPFVSFNQCDDGQYKFILNVNNLKKEIDKICAFANICVIPCAEAGYISPSDSELLSDSEIPVDYELDNIKWFPSFDSILECIIHKNSLNVTYYSTIDKVVHEILLSEKKSFPSLLAPHSHLKKTDLQTQNLWVDVSAKYRRNPFLAGPLKNTLAQSNFEQIPGMPDDSLRRKLSGATATDYPWQGVVFDNNRLEADQAVSYQDKVESYRTPVVTASDNLQTASDQFGSESKKLKRGLSTADLAAGLSDFIVERAQEELNVTFLSRLREGILGDTAEFTILFPETRKMLSEFRIVQYRTLLDFAKNAFILDLRNLGVNFPKLFKLKLYKYRKIWNDPRVYNIFLLYDIANKVYEDMPVDTILLHIHKQLHERRIEVSKSINERLAQTVMQDTIVKDSLTRLVKRYENRLKIFEAIHDTLINKHSANWAMHIKSREFTLAINNLEGDPDYKYVRDHLSFETHQAYFAKPPKPEQVISTGIDWARTLLSRDSILGYFEHIAAMEGRLAVMDSIKRQQEDESARANRQPSAYIPIFERCRDIMTQRACLELALVTEMHLDSVAQLKRLTEHDRQALIYLHQVLKSPDKYKIYDWDRVDAINSMLLHVALDSCIVCKPGTFPDLRICDLSGKPLDEYYMKQKIYGIGWNIESISSEMEKAHEFLDKMAMAIKTQFNEIARDTAYKNAPNISGLADTVYYNQFLFSREMTERTLAFNYEKFLLKMQEVIKADEGGGKNMPHWEVLKNDNLKQHIRNYQDAWRRNTIARDITGNYFLDYYNQTPPFDTSLWTVKTKGTMAQLLDSTRRAIASLDSVSRQFHDYIDTLQNKYAGDLLRSLKQTGEFGLLTQITLQWLYAFQDGSEQADSVVLRDSTLQHVVQFEPAGKEPKPDDITTEAADKALKPGDIKTAPADKKHKLGDIQTAQYSRQVSYDTIRVNKRKIGDRRWITPKKFNDMMEDTLLRRCFMGLLYQRLAAIEGGARYDARSMALLATKFMNTIYDIDDRREMLRYKKETNQPLRFEDYYPFIRSTVDMLNFVLETPFQAGGDPLIERFETLRDVPKISNEVLSLFENVFAENYPNAIHNVVQLLSITWGLDVKTEVQRPRAGAATATE
ncbi:MAG: hypothetical protein L6Q97_20450, partial [Thermoanaerobaculia bacterium]|nr:hypothetical protein [Thermoanaerobaculia bacterium]